jgi:multiple sugar transport system substrate-binding protein
MDDNTVFNNQSNTSVPPSEQNPPDQRISVSDLYAPSTNSVPIESGSGQAPSTDSSQPVSVAQPSVEPLPTENTENIPADSPPPKLANSKKLKIIIGAIASLAVIVFIISLVVGIFRSKPLNEGYNNTTLTYWGLWEEKKTLQPVIDDFEKKYPGIKVNYIKQDPDKYKDRLLTRIKNGTEDPDVFTYHNTWLLSLTNSSDNVLLPLPISVVVPDEFKKTYFPVVFKDLSKNGAIYGLPQGIDTLALFINKDIFQAGQIHIPQTWDEFNTAAKTLTVKDGNKQIKTSGAAMGLYDNITHAPDIISLLLATNGVDVNTIDKQPNYVGESISYYTSFAKGNDSVWDGTLINSRDAFAAGNLAMYFGYSWDIFAIQAANKNLLFEIHPVPYLPKGGNATTKQSIASYWANGVSKKSKHQKEALLLIKYLAQKDVVQKIYSESSKTRLFGVPYARIDLAATLSDNSMIYPFVKQAKNASSSYFASDTHDTSYNEPLNDYLANAIRQVHSSDSVTSIVTTLLQGVSQVRTQIEQ